MPLNDTLLEEADSELVAPRRRTQRIDAPVARSRPRTFELSDDAEMQLKEMARSARPAQAATAAQPKAEKPLGLMGTIREGAKGSLRALGATADTMQGDAQGVVKAAQEQADAPKDPDLERFYSHIEEQKKALGDNPSLWEGIKAVGSAAIDNPRGFGLMIAEQLPNSGVALGAAGAGALAGSFAGPIGAGVGALAGLATANIGLETGAKALEAAADKEFTPEEQSRVRREGLVKGGVITGVDAATLGATKFITNTSRRAVEHATTKALADRGVDVTSDAARKAAMKTPEIADAVKEAQDLARRGAETLGKRLAVSGGAVALETIGEGAGEYLGELAATGKANAVDAVIEGFAGLGTSIGEIATTSALNRKGLQRLLDTQEEAQKTAEKETKETGVEHEVIKSPTEPEKFVAVPKVRSISGIELERDETGNLKPVAPVSTQADFNLANRPSFELTAEDKLRKRELERQREAELARNPIITPTLAGKPVSDLPIEVLNYTVNRGSTRSREIAARELERRQKEGDTGIPEKPEDTVTRIVATGAEKAQEDAKAAKVIVPPTPRQNNAAKAAKTANPVKPETTKPAKTIVPEKQAKSDLHPRASELFRKMGEMAAANPTETNSTKIWKEQNAEQIANPSRYHALSEEDNPKSLKIGDAVIVKGKQDDRRYVVSVATIAGRQQVHTISPNHYGGWNDLGEVEKAGETDTKPAGTKSAKAATVAAPKAGPAVATEAKLDNASGILPHVESLIKRRAAAKETGKERSVNNAIQRAKELLDGKRTDHAMESKWFRVQAATMRKSDPETADILGRISEAIKASSAIESKKEEANTEAPKKPEQSKAKVEKAKTAKPAVAVRGDQKPVPRGGRILANGIAETIQKNGVAALVGQKITSPERLAELAQIYRNPQYETFRIFFTKGNEIVHASGVTARLPGSTPLFPKDMATAQGAEWIKGMMQSSGADGYWMLHNHPSGNPTPSNADVKVTNVLAKLVPGFKGHVIINSNKYAHISASGGSRVVTRDFGEDKLLQASKPSEYLGRMVPDPAAVVGIGKSFQKEGWVTLIGVSGVNGVRAIAEIPVKTFTNPAFARGAIRRFGRRSGAESIFAYGKESDLKAGNAAALTKEGFLRSAVNEEGKTHGIGDPSETSFGRKAGTGGLEVRQPDLRTGKETLEKYGLKPGKKYLTREVAAALEARQREKHGKIERDDRSDKAANDIAEWMKEEVLFEMEHPQKSGVGWYSEKFQRAIDTMAGEFPELANDKTARDTFTVLIAIASDGQKVKENFMMAADMYANVRKTGQFITARGHARGKSINNNLEILQKIYEARGADGMRDYLMQERTVSELSKLAKESGIPFSTDYQVHIKLPMAAVVLGPKLGAFYANLMGASGYLTMDRWWSRTFNRYRGSLITAPTRSSMDTFKKLMGNPSASDDEVLSAVIAPRNSYKKKGYKNGTEIEKKANTIYKNAFENIEDSPFNAGDRTFMLKAVALAQEKLAQDGINITIADIQAVLWYYEKRLYGDLGARETADISYEEAAERTIAERAGLGGLEGRSVPESGTDEELDDSGRVGEEDYESLSTGLESPHSPFNPGQVSSSIRDRFDKIADSLIYNFQDRFKPLKDIQKRAGPVAEDEDAALAEERYSGTVRARLDTFEDQLRDPLLKAIHDSGVSYEDVEEYLHALHAPSRNAAMREINPTEPELNAQISALENQRDTLAKDQDVARFIQLRRELRQAQADVEDGIADESLVRGLQSDIAQIRKQQNVKDYAEALDKLKALRLVKPFKGDNTALSGMSDDEAKAVLAKADKNGTRAKLDKVSAIIDRITAATRQIYVDGGLEKADAINAWNQKYEHYVPLHREEVGGNTMPKVGQGFNIRGKESKRATGSNKAVSDILAHVVAQHEAAIIRSEKARVDRALFQFASTHPDPSLWTLDVAPKLRTVDPISGFVVERVDPTYKNRPEVLTLKIDGEEHTITFNEQNLEAMRLAASMKNLASSELGEVTQLVGRFTRFLATMNTTANPVFVARNFMRDLQTTYINLSDTALAQKKAEVFRDIPAAIKGMWNLTRGNKNSQWAKYAQEFKAAGGQTGWMEHYKDIGTRADALRKELAGMQPGKLNAAMKAFRSLRDFVNDANNAVENGARLSAYVNARRSGLSEGKAAQLAKNLTVNFNARGAKSVELNAWYMFMNASIQGTARLAKAMSNRQVRKIVAGIIVSGFVMDILARSMAGDDDEDGENDYDQLPEHTKAMNFVFMVGGQPVTIPMPYGYNFFASAGRKVSEMIFRENYSPVRSAADLAAIFLDAFSPTGQAGSALQFAAPTVADPFIQWAENKNFAGNPLRKDQNQFGPPHPEYQMGFRSTSAPAKWLAEMLNDTTGGNEVRPGFINVNPVFFDFTVSSILGGAGRTYLQITSGPLKAVGNDEIQAREIPFANIFVGARPEYQTERKYFEAVGEVELAEKEFRTYREKGDIEMVRQIREEHGHLLRLKAAAKQTKELLARLRKNDLALDKQDLPNKAQLRREIEEKKRELMSRFNKKYREAITEQ